MCLLPKQQGNTRPMRVNMDYFARFCYPHQRSVKRMRPYPKYGVQKGWERVTSPETGAEDFSEITDAEAQQLGFPF